MLEVFLKYGAGPSARIVLDLSPRIPECLVDPSQFAAAILNLVINARDAMPHGGVIQIGTARYEPAEPIRGSGGPNVYVRVRVQDNGLGMSGPVVEKIFEPFFTTKGEKGTGLGVPQVCAFMRNVGGRVSVASELGRGTTFDLLFPAIEDQVDRTRAAAADRFTGADAGERALGDADRMTKDFNVPSGQAVSIAAA
jgi:signal transduction histidine kinase